MNKGHKYNLGGFLFLAFNFLLLTFIFSGCATVPKEAGLPVLRINGTNYVPLLSVCETMGINWDYDTFSRTVSLSQCGRSVNLMLGSSQVFVDGSARDIRYPVDIHEGRIVVPYRFKEEILDSLFKPGYVAPAQPAVYLGRIRKIIIDPGHGGRDPGAIGRTGLKEKDVCLDIAKRLKTILEAKGIEVILTRPYDKTLVLSDRSNLANSRDADLFVSIHANANRVKWMNGFEVYHLTSNSDDTQRALLAAKEDRPVLKDAVFANDSLSLKATVWDLIYTQNRSESMELARHICSVVRDTLYVKNIRVKGANFYVLKSTHMPAILVEVGFLSNYNEEKTLKSPYYRQQLAEAIASGLLSAKR